MSTIKLDFENGLVFVDSTLVAVDEKGVLARSIAKLCSPPIQIGEGRTRYRLARKITVCGKSADCVIEVAEGKLFVITFLFDFIEFFESTVLESKVLKACEKTLGLNFISTHPSTAFLDCRDWGRVSFFYDAKQGDLSLEIAFKHNSSEPIMTR